jgi:hypothetical protein
MHLAEMLRAALNGQVSSSRPERHATERPAPPGAAARWAATAATVAGGVLALAAFLRRHFPGIRSRPE